MAADCWSPSRNKGGKGESFVADAQEVQADKKDPLVTKDSSPQHGGSFVGLFCMPNYGLDVGLGWLQRLLTDCLLKGHLDIGCTDTMAGAEWLAHCYESTAQQLVQEPGSMHFTFGGGDTKLADLVVFIYILIDYHWGQLRLNVIDGPTPLLIGHKTLSPSQARIDVTKCEVHFWIFCREIFMPCELSSMGTCSCSFADRPGSLAYQSWLVPIDQTARPLRVGRSLLMETGTRQTCRRLFVPCMSRCGILIRRPCHRCLRSVFPGVLRSQFLRF